MLDTVQKHSKGDSEVEATVPLSLRVPRSLLVALRMIAQREDRSLNAQVARVFREWLSVQPKDIGA